jgi:hypothetical protein
MNTEAKSTTKEPTMKNTPHTHEKMPLLHVAAHLIHDHGYDPQIGQNVYDLHDHLHTISRPTSAPERDVTDGL